MKKLYSLLFVPLFAFSQTGEECGKIEDNTKRLECYDGIFVVPNTDQNTQEEQTKTALEKLKQKMTSWEYNEIKDEMRGTTTYTAQILSINTVEFDFPYNGGSMLGINLRKHPQYGNDVMFAISKGQFNCRVNEYCKVSVKFDDNPVQDFPLAESESGSSQILFIEGSKQIKTFTSKLKISKKLIVELPFHQAGKEQFTFNVEGLEWKHF